VTYQTCVQFGLCEWVAGWS